MKQILLKVRLIFTIKTQINSRTTFDNSKVRGEILKVKKLGKHVIHGVKRENKMCFVASWRHTNRFGAWKKQACCRRRPFQMKLNQSAKSTNSAKLPSILNQ
jgi:hypothetical protein